METRYPDLEDRRLIYETIRRMIGTVVNDLIETTRDNITAVAPQSIDDVRVAGKPLVMFSPTVYEQHVQLKRFLNRHLYSHEQKLAMTHKAQAVIRELFELYFGDVHKMPTEFAHKAIGLDEPARARVVADYVAGMTDRYAIAEHDRLIGKT